MSISSFGEGIPLSNPLVLISALAQWVPLELQGESQRLDGYLAEIIANHQQLSQLDVASTRQAYFDLPRPRAADFQERWIQFARSGEPDQICFGWAGIRFRNLDPQTPFVACTLSQETALLLEDAAWRAAFFAKITQEFAVFQPHGLTLRLFQEPGHDMAPFQVWNRYWLGQTQALSVPASSLPIQMQALDSMQAFDYPRFVAQHQFWRLLNADLAPWVSPVEAEELEQSIAQGLCFQAFFEGQPIGLMAGLKQDYYGLQAVSVLEFLIYPSFQGRGFGKQLQLLLLEPDRNQPVRLLA